MATPALSPPPLQTALANNVGLPSPTWSRWLQELWNSLRVASSGSGGSALSDAAPQSIGTTAAGIGSEASRSDHVHAHGSLGGGALHAVAVASGAEGFLSGSDKAKLDGISSGAAALTSSSPADVGASAVGVAGTAARADHVHAHGNQAGGSLHALAVAGVSAGFVSAADQTKLDNLSGVNSGDGMTLGQILALSNSWALP